MLPFYENKMQNIEFRIDDNLNFPPHLHLHIEMVYIFDGQLRTVVDGKTYTVEKGEILIVFPNQVHSYESGENHYAMFIFPLSVIGNAAALIKKKKPVNPVLQKECLGEKAFFYVEEAVAASNEENELLLQAAVQLLFLKILNKLALTCLENSLSENLAARAITFIAANYREQLSQQMVAHHLNINKYYLSRLLGNALGMGYCEYVNCLRVEHAKSLLKTTQLSVLEISLESGFENLRTFNRAFKQFTNTTPRQFRAQ